MDGDLRHLSGHVHMESIDKKFDADKVDYNDDTGDVEAWGNIRYENFLDGTRLTCDHLKYNVTTETGIFYDIKGRRRPGSSRGRDCSPPTIRSISKASGANGWMANILSTKASSPIAKFQSHGGGSPVSNSIFFRMSERLRIALFSA